MSILTILALAFVAYFALSSVLWTQWMASDPEGVRNPLIRAEIMGCSSWKEAIAFRCVKYPVILILPFAAAIIFLIGLARGVDRTRPSTILEQPIVTRH